MQTVSAAGAAGAIAYYSRRPVVDIFGLNDLHIGHVQMTNMGPGQAAHEKKDPGYVLNRKPDYILAFWDDYFSPVKEQLEQGYERMMLPSPTGPDLVW